MDGAAVRVFGGRGEELLGVQLPVLVVDGVVEGDDHHLRHFGWIKAT